VLVAGSYGRDEPVAEVLQAARRLGAGVVAITGRRSNAARNGHDISDLPPNVVLTDYVSVSDFDDLLQHCDVVLGLTRHDGIQLSVCNEALGFGRPLVMSGTPLLRALFGSGAIAVDSSDPEAIAAGIQRACEEPARWAAASAALAHKRREEWRARPLQECLALLGREACTEPAGRADHRDPHGRPDAEGRP
jgi:glycosyltransferase involved in cell wall biosynthesis